MTGEVRREARQTGRKGSMHKADGGCRSRPARITLCRVARESGSAGVPAGISGSSSRASRSSCIDSTNAAPRWRAPGGAAETRRLVRGLPWLGVRAQLRVDA